MNILSFMSQVKDLNLSRPLTSNYRLIVHGEIENISRKTTIKFQELLKQLSSEYRVNFECRSYSVLDAKGLGYKVMSYRVEPKDIPDVESKDIPDVESKDIPDVESKDIPDVESKDIPDVESKLSLLDFLYLQTYQTMCEVEQRIDSFLEEEKSKVKATESISIKLISMLLDPKYVIPIMLVAVFTAIFFVFRK